MTVRPWPEPLRGALDMLWDEAPSAWTVGLFRELDWARASADQVGRVVAAFAQSNRPLPQELVRAVTQAGHGLAADHYGRAGAALAAHGALNRGDGDLADQIRALTRRPDLPADEVLALAKALLARGHDGLAAELGLSHWWAFPSLQPKLSRAMDALTADYAEAAFQLLSFSTTDYLAEGLGRACLAQGLRVDITAASFTDVIPQLLSPQPNLAATVVVLEAEGLFGLDWRQDGTAAIAHTKLTDFETALAHAAQTRDCPILVTTLPAATTAHFGFLDCTHPLGASALITEANRRLAALSQRYPSLILIDADQALAELAPAERFDAKQWFYGRIAFLPVAANALARTIAACYRALKRGPQKVLALDLDNTCWGGTVGEDGVANLYCDDDPPGNAFKALQLEALRLKRQGMLLVILSKNNPDAIEVFAQHPGMALQKDDFVAWRINWKPKPDNIRDIAEELNLGLDSFIFLDDSPHEREAMRRLAPQVLTPELPLDAALRPAFLRRLIETWPVKLTAEDARRSDFYLAERKSRELRDTAATFEDYLAGLDQSLILRAATPQTLPRIAQMHARTNQFNLTTERLDDAQLGAMMAEPERFLILSGQVMDKFGDHGVVIAGVIERQGTIAQIRTLLMSCRVIGREIERAFLGELIGWALARGVTEIAGLYLPTAKNAMVSEFYANQGFRAATPPQGFTEGATAWCLTPATDPLPSSRFVAIRWDATQTQKAAE